MSESGERDDAFLQETWALYGIGMIILTLRFLTRIKTVGFRGFQGDDYFSLLVVGFYTMDAATVHIIYYAGTNVEAGVLQATRPLTSSEIDRFEFGSKEQLAAWYSYTALIWCLKGTMLCFFKRLTIGLWHTRVVNWLSIACVVSYIGVFLTITFGCFPTQRNWQVVPNPGEKCTLKLQNFLVTVVFNIITDAAILCIPIPLLWKLQVTWRKKIVIGVLLSSGLFVIAAAIIRVVLTLSANPSALNINRWGVRETIVGIITVNIPILRPLLTRSFWSLQPFKGPQSKSGLTEEPGSTSRGPYKMTSSINTREGGSHRTGMGGNQKSFDGSQEFIIGNDDSPVGNRKGGDVVMVHTSYQVNSEEVRGDHDPDWHYGAGGANTSNAFSGPNAV